MSHASPLPAQQQPQPPLPADTTHPSLSPPPSALRNSAHLPASSASSSTARASTSALPSVQFDEQSLLASPSLHRERLSSSNGHSNSDHPPSAQTPPTSSPKVASVSLGAPGFEHLRSPSSQRTRSQRQQQQQRRENGASSASTVRPSTESNNTRTTSPRMNPSSRINRLANPSPGSSYRASSTRGWNRPVVTIPSWARDESPSPPLSPTSSNITSTTASRNNANGGSSINSASNATADRALAPSPTTKPAPRLDASGQAVTAPSPEPAHEPTDGATAEATNTWPSAPGTATHTITEEPGEAALDSPERWWTFTLPQKYRTRLHEHHLKMSFHHQRLKENAEANGAAAPPAHGTTADKDTARGKPTPQRSGSGPKAKPPKKKRTNSSREDSVGSDYESDDGDDDGGRRGRFFDDGLAANSGAGAAAGLGESGLLNWRHGGQRPSYFEKRHSSQSAERTLTPSGEGQRPGDQQQQHQQQRQPKRYSDDDGNSDGDQDGHQNSDVDLEKQQNQQRQQQQQLDEKEYPTMSFKARMEHPDVYTVHQPATPGWASPWKPEERGGGHSIEIDGYRFRPNGTGYFPRTDTGRSSRRRRRAWLEWWKNFLIHNPFVPLLFRFLNISFTTATLAVAIELFQTLHEQQATDAVGSSPVVAIVFAPLTLVHIAFQIWIEYFGRPIGLWTVQSKLFYTIIELIFICFWSAELSLAFDNYFTSTLVCVSFGNPFGGSNNRDPQPLLDMSKKPYLCRLQGALIGLVFVSLLAYLIVLTVSLFRIFVRVTGGRR
ncbi:uncharacterized protein PFL1_03341 [Pseudozyma flocculosa PF-1]|uniref:Uncharacterized protein n=2 Tax=Pseudozyma flocculosa TaxID=84751 RepID=A0A5C3F7L5_9BASI|nr:uncharacterized protein PFL1_03341 [Pseudozyma flocculosa PF-1]EPQ29052.1 hypothetical protein PFL1_03341 [Pseudozyma flocculosa PF-1]SPO40046.1 uncharacterized protein PSFLO_05528 [Pseudozyma flocculosa]